MTKIEYRTVDKSAWPRGPWDEEPDKIQWRDETTGLPCLIVRGPLGSLCGYVGVSSGHPWHGENYEMINGAGVDVHGGLTFSDGCSHGDEATGICHVPAPGESDDVWWLGFDCGHYRDRSPAYESRVGRHVPEGIYRDVAYVTAECAALALQVRAARRRTA